MTYDISWLIHRRILLMTYIGDGKQDEMKQSYIDHLNLVKDEGLVPVHVILDASQMTNLQVKVSDMGSFTDTTASHLFGWTIIVTDNRFMKFLIAVFAKLTGSQFKTVENYDDAVIFLRNRVPDLLTEAI